MNRISFSEPSDCLLWHTCKKYSFVIVIVKKHYLFYLIDLIESYAELGVLFS